MMAENYCYFHYIREWQKMINQGRLGTIVYAESEYIHEIVNLLVDPNTGERHWRSRRAPISGLLAHESAMVGGAWFDVPLLG